MTAPSLIYHLGDIHGRHDLLAALLRWVEADAEERGREPAVFFLGDIVDRGPDSMRCMGAIMETLNRWTRSRLILGNHDEWFLEAVLTDGKFDDIESWLLNGGIATIESYCSGEFDPEAPKLVRDQYPGHIRMLESASRMLESGPFIAVHAGINPLRPLDAQQETDLNWIRAPFLNYVDPDMRPVVHGHTIVGRLPVVTENRVSIDTGAYRTGLLTCFVVDTECRDARFVQASEIGVADVEPMLADRGHGTVLDRLPTLFAGQGQMEPAL